MTEIPTPVVRPGEVLIRVRAAAVTSGDARIRGARFPRGFAPFARLGLGLRAPRRPVLGMSLSGVVDSVGPDVSQVAPGDEVCAMTGSRMGGHAEYAAAPATRVVTKPAGVSHDDAAAALFGGSTALHFLRDKAHLEAGQSVLVVGGAGAVGTNAIQLAKHFGATVTAVTSAPNAELVRDLGADHVVDYTSTPVTGPGGLATLGRRYDVVFDTVGTLTPATGRALLTERGVLLLAVASLGQILVPRSRVKAGPAPERADDMSYLLDLVGSGRLRVVLDAALPLDDIVAAYRRIDSGRKVGNIVVRM